MTHEYEIRRSAIDRLYQLLLSKGEAFTGELREVFHKAMEDLKAFPQAFVSNEQEIPAEELERIDQDAAREFPDWVTDFDHGQLFHVYVRGARAEYLRHLSGKPSTQEVTGVRWQQKVEEYRNFVVQTGLLDRKSMQDWFGTSTPTVEPVKRWVKCMDRMPVVPNPVPQDTPDERPVIFWNERHSSPNYWFPSWGSLAENIFPLEKDVNRDLYDEGFGREYWEWLEEIPSIVEPAVETEEVQKLRGLLLEIGVRAGIFFPTEEWLINLFDIGFKGCFGLFVQANELLYDNSKDNQEQTRPHIPPEYDEDDGFIEKHLNNIKSLRAAYAEKFPVPPSPPSVQQEATPEAENDEEIKELRSFVQEYLLRHWSSKHMYEWAQKIVDIYASKLKSSPPSVKTEREVEKWEFHCWKEFGGGKRCDKLCGTCSGEDFNPKPDAQPSPTVQEGYMSEEDRLGEVVNDLMHDVADLKKERSSLQSQLYNSQQEAADYRKALDRIRGIYKRSYLKDMTFETVLEILDKYPTPQTPNNE